MSVLMSKDKKELIVTCNCKCGQSFHITVDDEDRDSDIMFYLCYMKNNFDTEYDMNPWRAFKIKMKKIWFIIRGKHLKDIHHFIFQDIFDWAGQIRTIDIGKGNLFCRAQFIESYAESVFRDFFSSCCEARSDRERFVDIFAKHYADMNALHPFREGNGRAQREFARELCLECGYVFDLTQTTHKEMLEASIQSFNTGNNDGFVSIFGRNIIPIDEYKEYQSRLTSTLLILSKDDI